MAEQNKRCASGEIWKGDNNNRGFEILYVIQLFSPTAWSYELAAWAAYSWLNQFQLFLFRPKTNLGGNICHIELNTLYISTQVIPGISFGTLYKRSEGGVGGEKIVEIIVGKTLKACGGSISGKAGRDVRRCFTACPSTTSQPPLPLYNISSLIPLNICCPHFQTRHPPSSSWGFTRLHKILEGVITCSQALCAPLQYLFSLREKYDWRHLREHLLKHLATCFIGAG